jgi:hypothetical protein
MTQSTDQTPASDEAQVLSYRPPSEDFARLSPAIVCATAIVAAIVVFMTVVGSVLLMVGAGNGWPLLIIPAVLVGLAATALRLRKGRGHARSMAMGVWIGAGVGLLAQGVCWGVGMI